MCLWYRHPARRWMEEALPIGNGRLGAVPLAALLASRSSSMKIAFGRVTRIRQAITSAMGAYPGIR